MVIKQGSKPIPVDGYLSESGHKNRITLYLLPVCEDLEDSWATSTGIFQEIHLPPVSFLKLSVWVCSWFCLCRREILVKPN